MIPAIVGTCSSANKYSLEHRKGSESMLTISKSDLENAAHQNISVFYSSEDSQSSDQGVKD